jgi:hypothetical protein
MDLALQSRAIILLYIVFYKHEIWCKFTNSNCVFYPKMHINVIISSKMYFVCHYKTITNCKIDFIFLVKPPCLFTLISLFISSSSPNEGYPQNGQFFWNKINQYLGWSWWDFKAEAKIKQQRKHNTLR